jgi:hypothetical protein
VSLPLILTKMKHNKLLVLIAAAGIFMFFLGSSFIGKRVYNLPLMITTTILGAAVFLITAAWLVASFIAKHMILLKK